MRICDWSSDVCSSDLSGFQGVAGISNALPRHDEDNQSFSAPGLRFQKPSSASQCIGTEVHQPPDWFDRGGRIITRIVAVQWHGTRFRLSGLDRRRLLRLHRSEEHKSELQSLMRISYAGFCLKKKK